MNISNINRPIGIATAKKPVAAAKTEAAAPQAAAPATPSESASFGSVPARIASVSPAEVAKVADQWAGIETVPGEMIVKMNAGLGESLLSDVAAEYGAKVIEKFDMPEGVFKSIGGDMLRLKLPQGIDVNEAVAAMGKDERIAYAEPNQVITLEDFQAAQSEAPQVNSGAEATPAARPNDLDPGLWGMENNGQTGGKAGADVNALGAWEIQTGNGGADGPLIAVIDTGIDYNHPDLKNNMWTNPGEIPGDGIDNDGNGIIDDVHGYYPGQNSGEIMDGNGHGTHCSGTIAAEGNNGIGVTGVMQNARLLGVKIFSDAGRTTAADIIKGINYATSMNADITSNSWGGGGYSQGIKDAFAASEALHVIAAGNSNYDNDKRDNFPSNYDLDNIVAVAATNHNDEKASFSQYGATKVDVAAPGRNILSTWPQKLGKDYNTISGTSMATPNVSGGAGLLMSQYPEMSNEEIKARLIHGSDRVDALTDVSVSDGRVNYGNSLEDDTVAPGAPNDFQAGNVTSRGGELSWTAVGDDKWEGGAAQHVSLRYSDQPLSAENPGTEVSFGGADEVGDLMKISFGGAPSETASQVHFAMQSIDNVGNHSEVRTATMNIPAAAIALSENFDGDSTGFTASGDFASVAVEGRGNVFSSKTDASTGASALTSGNIDLSDKTGTFLKFDSEVRVGWGGKAAVQVSEDGENWTEVANLGRRSDWSENGVDLSAYDGKSIQVRFESSAREGRRSGGLSVDNVKLLADNA